MFATDRNHLDPWAAIAQAIADDLRTALQAQRDQAPPPSLPAGREASMLALAETIIARMEAAQQRIDRLNVELATKGS